MKINTAISELWKNGYFLEHRRPSDVKNKLFDEYQITCSNILMQLKSCKKFLRLEDKGWIQKNNADFYEGKKTEVEYFRLLNIHPEIESVSKKLFYDKHYAQAIFEAFKKINNLVKEKSCRKDLDGKSLMLTAFSVNSPLLKMNGLVSQSDKDEQEGFMHLYAGAIMGIRNPKGHENIIQKDKNRALKYLSFASLLCERLEECNTMVK
ncbi:TIGR02391 family protein [archaeon]|nr:TIGR02391 family protein [Nanoarchaeota archaeon]MCG2724158.1 TIGR02391 family protein [archaeon]